MLTKEYTTSGLYTACVSHKLLVATVRCIMSTPCSHDVVVDDSTSTCSASRGYHYVLQCLLVVCLQERVRTTSLLPKRVLLLTMLQLAAPASY